VSLVSQVRVPYADLPGSPRVLSLYATGDGTVRKLLGGGLQDLGERVATIRKRSYPRAALREALEGYLSRLGAPPASLASASRLADPRCVVVATGQQPGLGASPVLTLYKAATAVSLARHIEETGLGPAVPLFWCHSADHDLDEMNRIGLLDAEMGFVRHRAELEAPPRTPAERVLVAGPVENLWTTITAQFPATDYARQAIASLRPESGDTLGSWTSRILLRLLGEEGLLVLEPLCIRRLFDPWAKLSLDRGPDLVQELRERTGRLRSASLEAPLDVERPTLLFRMVPGQEGALSRERVHLAPGGAGGGLPGADRAASGSWSPAAALRPVFQSAVLPVAAAILGPTELAYHAQIGGLFDTLGVPPPILIPRLSVTLVDDRTASHLTEKGLDLRDIPHLPERLAQANDSRRPELPSDWATSRDNLTATLEGLLSSLAAEEPSLRKKGEKARERITGELDRLAQNYRVARERASEIDQRRLRRLVSLLAPRDRLQERELSTLQMLVLFGPGLVDLLVHELDSLTFDHKILRVGRDGLVARARSVTRAHRGDAP